MICRSLPHSQQSAEGEGEAYDDEQEDDGADQDGTGHVDRPADAETLGHPDCRVVTVCVDDAVAVQPRSRLMEITRRRNRCWKANRYVIDPHTACAYFVAQQMPRDPLTPRVILATASPYKFPRVVNEALGFDATGTDFDCMDVLARETGTTAPAALRGLETADVRFDTVVSIDGMESFVEQSAKAL